MSQNRKICVGMILSAHGVRGLVRLRSFTEDPETIAEFKSLTDEAGEQTFAFTIKSASNDFYIAEIKGVKDRDAAHALRGTKLYVPRASLPKTSKTEYYEVDLVGLVAKDVAGKDYGKVIALHNYGGGPFLEIGKGRKSSFMLPFSDACVPKVDIKGGEVTVEVPDGWLDEVKPKKAKT